jgi:hypothetical protein
MTEWCYLIKYLGYNGEWVTGPKVYRIRETAEEAAKKIGKEHNTSAFYADKMEYIR